MKVSITHSKRLLEVTEDDITFTEEDADELLLPHKDALVISLNVLDYKIKRVLVDPGNSANIIQLRVLEQAKLIGSIIPATKLLAGFNLASITTRGEILLPANAEMKVVPSTYHQLLKFPAPEGVKQIRGNQPVAREMNAISVSSSEGKGHEA
ncbi:PREDICTED: uncharacterized protein LOC109238084 [Nicotiana attenuata]|uniref:uncharacterized protein LOC109238084 n=1 Tax=Nicotiana attenuata TaxID=49451 RepID=UPI000904B5E1|nr:PREDICTED: uncharacterized protein LOC109238084 [Nicotiana attenuata]